MSVLTTSFVIENSKHKGSMLLLLIMIADAAHPDGTGSYPSIATLAKRTRLSERQVKRMLPELEASGELVVFWSKGRRSHEYAVRMGRTNRDILSRLIAEYEQNNSDKMSPLTVTDPNLNSDKSRASTVTNPTPAIKEERSEEHSETREPRSRSSQADPRSSHPAIMALREVTGRYPAKEIYDDMIATIGDMPDLDRLRKVNSAWIANGFKPTNYAGIVDWYHHGIPLKNQLPGTNSTNGHRTHDPQLTGEIPLPPPEPERILRVNSNVPKKQRDVWWGAIAVIKKKLNTETFATWFNEVRFDGIHEDTGAVCLRARSFTVDWIETYYSELVATAIVEVGLDGFKAVWEKDDGEVVAPASNAK